MAISRLHTWASLDILYATDLNAEFDNLINNGTSAAFPLTAAVSFAGYDVTNAGNMTFSSGKKITLTAAPFYQALGTAVASAATVDLSLVTGNTVHITGSTGPITSFGTVQAGVVMTVVFDSTPTITYNATSMILPGSADITAAAGDTAFLVSEGSGNWRCAAFERRSAVPIALIPEARLSIADNTTANVTTSAHGFVPKAPNITTQFLRGDATWAVPSTVNVKVGTFTYDTATASGTTTITGVGFTPKLFLFDGAVPGVTGQSFYGGKDDATTHTCIFSRDAIANFQKATSATHSLLSMTTTDVDYAAGLISSFNSDGGVITWTKVGAPTGTITVNYVAIG